MRFEYLLFDLFILAASTCGVLLYKRSVWPQFLAGLTAIVAVALPFLVWDHLVTDRWWSFNSQYILGVKLAALPIEEVLFFLVVPWSCLIIWENLKQRIDGRLTWPIEVLIGLCGLLLSGWALTTSSWYTAAAGSLLIVTAILSMQLGQWLTQKSTLFFLCLVFALTIVFNGYLTGRPIVMYTESVIIGLRIGTVPIEDVIYGFALVSWVVMLYEQLIHSRQTDAQSSRS